MSNKKRISKLINKRYCKNSIISLRLARQHIRKLEKELRNIPIDSKIFQQKAKELRKARFKFRYLQSGISNLFESDPMKNPLIYWTKKIQEIMN